MFKQIMPAWRATIIIAILTGLVFPALVTLIAQIVFPAQSNGSLIMNIRGQIIGSKFIGQQFTQAKYFHPRPSAAGYAGEKSSGTNLGPTSSKLILGQTDIPLTKNIDESFLGIQQLNEKFRQENLLEVHEKTPVDAVTRSGSGLDPHISQANALFQARRIAKIRGLSLQEVVKQVLIHTESRQFGFLGEPRVNVLVLNLDLDGMNDSQH